MHARSLTQPKSLQDMLLYALWQLQASAGAAVVRLCEEEFGITRREWRLLAHVALHEGSLPSQVAEHAGLDRALTSRALTSLARKGLLTRTPRQGDRRQVLLHLTPAGRALYEALLPRVARLNQELLGALTAQEAQQLDALLARLHERARQLERARLDPAG